MPGAARRAFVPYEPPTASSLTAVGSFKCCKSVRDAVSIATKAMNTGACKSWFISRERYGSNYQVRLRGQLKVPCSLFGYFFWTAPGSNNISGCRSTVCEFGAEVNALLLIHEVAHHYVTFGPGREDAANEGMEACAEAVKLYVK